jgi:hypothetical protein
LVASGFARFATFDRGLFSAALIDFCALPSVEAVRCVEEKYRNHAWLRAQMDTLRNDINSRQMALYHSNPAPLAKCQADLLWSSLALVHALDAL